MMTAKNGNISKISSREHPKHEKGHDASMEIFNKQEGESLEVKRHFII